MNGRLFIILLLLLSPAFAVFSQVPRHDSLKSRSTGFDISGQVIDSANRKPIEFVTVELRDTVGVLIIADITNAT